eukprot:TRINITY_DN94418_c0_g1_i1.p1 TRINITY_DN94418_c0_g1~~TRINITY_DN94418_c0_g1_i1.p1  ORF type:complete len:196 (+),score=25.52 TRINITY_DN94418_c0_g1_i1:30-617(+)
MASPFAPQAVFSPTSPLPTGTSAFEPNRATCVNVPLRPISLLGINLAVGAAATYFRPARFLSPALTKAVQFQGFRTNTGVVSGTALIVAAFVLHTAARKQMAAKGTPIPHGRDVQALVTTGPYRISRNPLYLAAVMLQEGAALASNSLWFALGGLLFFLYNTIIVIPREERVLRGLFGEEYLDYRDEVSRWVWPF